MRDESVAGGKVYTVLPLLGADVAANVKFLGVHCLASIIGPLADHIDWST